MKIKILIGLVLLIGALLRFYQLGVVPISPDWDEVALAYEAHSLAVTGRDEFGKTFPPILRSFDDYKPAVYAYLALPFVQLFDLTPFAVRIPSAIMGLIGILALYFLVKELFKDKDQQFAKSIALLAAFSLALSPWHLQFSRTAFETNVGLTINILVALFFLKGLKNHWLLLASFFLAGLNLSVYQSERVFTPLLVLALCIIFRKELFRVQKKYLLGAVIAGFIAIVPVVVYFAQDQNAFSRIQGTSIFSKQTEVLKRAIPRLENDKARNDYLGLALNNRRTIYAISIADAYLSHFDPNWLFIKGDLNRHHVPRMGLLYIVLLPFLLFGLYYMVFGNLNKRTKYLVFSWFLLAPVPASITADVPHAVRTLNSLPMYDLFIAVGVYTFVIYIWRVKQKVFTKQLKYAMYSIVGAVFIFNVVYYLNQYFVQQNYYYAYDWQYGYAKAIPLLEHMKKDYKKVIVSDRTPLDKSYMFFLFYLKYPPHQFQEIVEAKITGSMKDYTFEQYEFRTFNWEDEKTLKETLFVGSQNDFPREIKAKEIIFYPNGERAILIVDPEMNQ